MISLFKKAERPEVLVLPDHSSDQFISFTDSQLTELVQKGNADAFIEIVSRYMPLVHRLAADYQSAFIEKDDLCQEGMLGLLYAARSYDEKKKAGFRTYAGICIRNRLIAVWRQAAGYKNLPMKNFLSLSEEEGMQVPSSDPYMDPEAFVAENESLDSLQKRITQALSKMEQQVLFLYLGGCGFDEIAQRLDVGKKSAYNALQRARGKLRQNFSSSICPGSLT